MMIEQNTSYAYKLKYIKNPSFDKIRGLTKFFINDLPKELANKLYEELDRGIDILDSEPHMLAYLYAYGIMHQAKLSHAFNHLPDEFLKHPEINIIDYGCGQALGTMCYIDYLKSKNINQKIKRVTLIEPSELCLKRAALHASVFLPNAEIIKVNRTFDELEEDDIHCDEDTPTLHILSNVLDMLSFDMDKFAKLVKGCLKGCNQFVCVGPYFNHLEKDQRTTLFANSLNGKIIYSQIFDKNEFDPSKTWTAQINCFSVGCIKNDDFDGGVYSEDGKKLLRVSTDVKEYTIRYGTEKICSHAFHLCDNLEQVTIPDTVISIDERAFDTCHSLQQIIIPDSVKHIGKYAFGWCESLEKITIPDSIISIDDNPINGCKRLKVISKSSRFIVTDKMLIDNKEGRLIAYLEDDEQIVLSNYVTSIGNYAFINHSALKQIIISDRVCNVGEGAFWNCTSLRQVIIPDSVMHIEEDAFSHCKSLQYVKLPESLLSLGNNVFFDCVSLQGITIPNRLKKIGDNPFCCASPIYGRKHCINIESRSQQFIIRNNMLIDEERHVIVSYLSCEKNVIIPDGITSIGNGAFWGCVALEHVYIPDTIETIGEQAFCACTSLKQITIPDSVKSIQGEAFYGCIHLGKINAFKSVITIGNDAFSYCTSLKEVVLPSSLGDIGRNPFCGCKNITITSDSSRFIVRNNMLIDLVQNNLIICKSEEEIISIPNGIIDIGDYSFMGNEHIKKVIIPNSVTNIGKEAFSCSEIMEITIPESVTKIGERSFWLCGSLKSIIVRNREIEIDSQAFTDCSSLKTIFIAKGSLKKIKRMLEIDLWDKLVEQ